MYILGITHPISWNPAAVLLDDGKILAAIEEERLVRIKHAPRMVPYNAIEWVLQRAGIGSNDVEKIAISWEGPHTKNEINNVVNEIQGAERDFWTESVDRENALMNFLTRRFKNSKIHFVNHHLAHAASSCFVSGFDKSLFLTIDGRGEFESGLTGIYEKGDFEIIRHFGLNESLGGMYERFTSMIGFRIHTDEGKTMGLAPYGNAIESLTDVALIKEDGKIVIDWEKLEFLLNNNNFTNTDPTKDKRKDLAATAQFVLEKCVLAIVNQLTKVSDNTNICLAGGCALNIDMNGNILSSGMVKDIFIQPASHDAGCALGAALLIHHQFSSIKPQSMKHAYFGPEWNDEEIKEFLDNRGLKYTELSDVSSEVAELLSKNKIIGWFQGRTEFGPRALGSRSLLANPTDPKMWKLVNKVKGREYWRPLAPSLIEEASNEFFIPQNIKSPFMLLRVKVKENRINDIPAVVHVDKSARPQTVSHEENNLYWNLLKEFERIQGVPVLINTSLNLRGEPIVNRPEDAVKTLFYSNMDYLCLNRYLVYK